MSLQSQGSPRVGRALEAPEPWPLRNSRWIVIVGGASTVALGLVAVFLLPTVDRVVGNFVGADLQRARADARTSGLALATGAGAATAGLLAWGRLELSRRQHQIDRDRYAFEEALQSLQHELAEQSQRNDRFARAVELLGHPDGSVRLGALYALEGLARDNFDRQTVFDVISAYARTHVPQPAFFEVVESDVPHHGQAAADEPGEEGAGVGHPEDVLADDYQAAITICLRVPQDWSVSLDLRGTLIVDQVINEIADVNLAGATLKDCYFDAARLARCLFPQASFSRCRFFGASLVDCGFAGATLTGCLFSAVSLVGTSFDGASLGDSVFDGTHYDVTTSWPAGKPPSGTAESAPQS